MKITALGVVCLIGGVVVAVFVLRALQPPPSENPAL